MYARPAGRARGRGDGRRPRARRRARADRRRGRDRLRGGPAGERQRRAEGRAQAPRRRACCDGTTVLEATRARPRVERGGRPARLEGGRAQLRLRPLGGVRRQRARPRRCLRRPAARTAYDEARGGLRCSRELPDARSRGRRARGQADLESAERSGSASPVPRLPTRSDSATTTRAPGAATERGRAERPEAWRIDRRRAAAGHERARRQVLRLPLRGRDREGHPPLGRGGLRLDRALQALHDHDDGPVPGPHVPAARGAADGAGDRHEPGRRGHHDRAPALARRADGRARRAALRAGEALRDPRAPPRARRQRDVGGRLAPRLRLRRPEGRGAWPCTRRPG